MQKKASRYKLAPRGVLQNRADLQRVKEMWAQLLCAFCREAGANTPLVPIILCQKPAFACWKCIKKNFL